MLSKCANPICVVPFRYLREGKIFNVEIKKTDKFGQLKIEHFWLCESCSKTLKVIVENGTVVTRPLRARRALQRSTTTRRVACTSGSSDAMVVSLVRSM